jgi:antibiotic biosynthesis monooxygenase (ABM) superfamily enzyme
MKTLEPLENKNWIGFFRFFDKALSVLEPPYMKLLVVLLVGLLLTVLILKGLANANLCFILVALAILIFAFFALILQYSDIKYRYIQKTEEELKKILREVVLELQRKKMDRG